MDERRLTDPVAAEQAEHALVGRWIGALADNTCETGNSYRETGECRKEPMAGFQREVETGKVTTDCGRGAGPHPVRNSPPPELSPIACGPKLSVPTARMVVDIGEVRS